MNNYAYLGIVQQGQFKVLATERDTAERLRLTTVSVSASEPPENGELSLATYEGSATLVRGYDNGAWIYSAVVVERAGLILTAIVQEVFASDDHRRQFRLRYPL
jgi:hypothetical protein